MPTQRCRRLWTPDGVVSDVTVERSDDGVIVALRPARAGDGPAAPGLVLPRLVNAHVHLELSVLDGKKLPPSDFVTWASRLPYHLRSASAFRGRDEYGGMHATALAITGTEAVVDVTNRGDTRKLLDAVGLHGIVQHEVLGIDPAQQQQARAALAALPPGVRGAPHALFSTDPSLVVDAVRAGPPGVPSTIHVGESEDEAEFLRTGTGPHADLLDRLGRDWGAWKPPGCTAIELLDALGVLGPDLLLVHGVHTTPAELALAAARGASFVLCARSNLNVGGRMPDVRAWRAAGLRFALGTDSLASNDDVDVFSEIPVLADAFPELSIDVWLTAATRDAADAIGRPDLGRVAVGGRARLVEIAGFGVDVLRVGSPARRLL